MYNNNRAPAVWTQVNDHFAVSEGGCLKPSGDAVTGRACFLTLDQAEYILLNQASLREAIEIQRKIVLNKSTSKERAKLITDLVKKGLTPEQASSVVQTMFDNAIKKTA